MIGRNFPHIVLFLLELEMLLKCGQNQLIGPYEIEIGINCFKDRKYIHSLMFINSFMQFSLKKTLNKKTPVSFIKLKPNKHRLCSMTCGIDNTLELGES